ncbi:hypothetical protein [Chryseobacterium glaciei]|nr:hypothetical protein [Chryseobacterium glaciei]
MEKQDQNQTTENLLTNEMFISELRALINKAPKSVTFSINVTENDKICKGVEKGISAIQGSPSNMILLYQEAFEASPEIKEVIFDAVSFYKFRKVFDSRRQETSIFDTIFGSSPFRR